MSITREGEAFGHAPDVGPVDDQQIAPLLYTMAECLCEQLAGTPGGAPCFCGVMPAALVPMDFCDCATANRCGMGYVRLDSLYPSRVFANPDIDARCGSPLAARIAVGVTRCLPDMDARGNPPGVDQQTEAVRYQMADMMAARRAIACCLDPATKYVLGAYTPVGPAGGCGGGQWLVTVQVI